MSGSAGAVRVLFFASLRDEIGVGELELTLATPLPFEDFLDQLAAAVPAEGVPALRRRSVRVALNQTFLEGSATVRGGDEVAFLPPVTGG